MALYIIGTKTPSNPSLTEQEVRIVETREIADLLGGNVLPERADYDVIEYINQGGKNPRIGVEYLDGLVLVTGGKQATKDVYLSSVLEKLGYNVENNVFHPSSQSGIKQVEHPYW